MKCTESKPDEPHEETMQQLHDALDSLEAHIKRIPVSQCGGPHPIDLVVQLRQRISALGLPHHGEVKSPVSIEENTTRRQFSESPHTRGDVLF